MTSLVATKDAPSILIIRRDNIGDLVCTTPLITGLRRHFPRATIAALVNSYNRDVLGGNPDLDAVYAYTKAKHRGPGESLLAVYLNRVRLFVALRRRRFDVALLATPRYQPHALRMARAAGVRQVIGFVDHPGQSGIDIPIPYGAGDALHEVEDVFRLGTPLGLTGAAPGATVIPSTPEVERITAALQGLGEGPVLAVHISARKPSQRWPAERFVATIRAAHAQWSARILLLWSPGSARETRHPGDDEKARDIALGLAGVPLLAWRTDALAGLIAALSRADAVVCADGGAMHLAAALGKPIVCLFGDSSPARWHPWATRHIVLQTPTRQVTDIPVPSVIESLQRLAPWRQ